MTKADLLEGLHVQNQSFAEALKVQRQDVAEGRTEQRHELAEALDAQRRELVGEISRQTGRVETRLLTEFDMYERRAEILRKRADSNLESLGERVELIESRLDEMEEPGRKNAN